MRILRLLLLTFTVLACASAQAPGAGKPAAEAKAAAGDVIDINSATEEQLRTVPGIGEAYAKKIVAGRPYRAKNELVQKKILPAGVAVDTPGNIYIGDTSADVIRKVTPDGLLRTIYGKPGVTEVAGQSTLALPQAVTLVPNGDLLTGGGPTIS